MCDPYKVKYDLAVKIHTTKMNKLIIRPCKDQTLVTPI